MYLSPKFRTEYVGFLSLSYFTTTATLYARLSRASGHLLVIMAEGVLVPPNGSLTDRATMLDMLRLMIVDLPAQATVEESSVFGQEHGMVSILYKVKVSAPGSEWDGRKMCVKWYAAHKFHGSDSQQAMRELRFYRDIAPTISQKINVPHCYGCLQCSDTISCIALELIEPPYRMPRQMEGMPLDEMELAVRAMASYHSFPLAEFSSWLAPMDTNISNVEHYLRGPFESITAEDIERVFPGLNGKEAYTALQDVCAPGVWGSLADVLRDGFPQHLLHYDYRGENLFFKRSEDASEVEDVIIYDWQHMCIGSGALELAYLLTSSMRIADRREHERALVGLYVEELQRQLGDDAILPSTEEYWLSYRLSTAYLLVWAVVILPHPEALVEKMGKTEEAEKAAALNMMVTTALRNFTAVLDHGSARLLREAAAKL